MSGPAQDHEDRHGDRHPDPAQGAGESDPSMDDILASIRRILNEDEASDAASAHPPAEPEPGVLVLDPAMMVHEPEPAPPVAEPDPMPALMAQSAAPGGPSTAPPLALDQGGLVDTVTQAAATSSVGHLVRTLATARGTAVHRGGPTLEDMVRDEIRPLLKEWLDANLPALVDRLVQAEIERVIKVNT